ncbi:Ribose-phosphate pyrophosphokinase, partial [Elasticomyces elasticus]
FVYTHVDERDWEKECWFELSMGGREYEVIACKPRVEKEAVDAVLERLNETRELAGFLKGMRTLFAEAVKG